MMTVWGALSDSMLAVQSRNLMAITAAPRHTPYLGCILHHLYPKAESFSCGEAPGPGTLTQLLGSCT